MDWHTANLLRNSKTSHETLKLPLNIIDETTCNISAGSDYGIMLQHVQVIIWDEITMTPKHAFKAVDRLFRDICNSDHIFIIGSTFKSDDEKIREKVILSPKNNDVLALNNYILSRLEGQKNVYLSVD